MAQFVNIYNCDLRKGPVVTSLHQMYLGDVEANRIGVRVTDNGEDVTLTGTCSGTAILCSGGTVAITGEVDGNLAYIDLPSAVYTVEGPVEIYVTLTQDGNTTTLLTAHGNAVRTDSGIVIDPGTIIPSVAALISDIEEAVATIPSDYSELSSDVADLKSDMAEVQPAVGTLEDDVSDLKSAMSSVEYVIENTYMTLETKQALLDCFKHVAWIDSDGQSFYDSLYAALYNTSWIVVNELSGCVTSNPANEVLKDTPYSATITPEQGYKLDGATVSVVMGGIDITSSVYSNGTISIASVTGKLEITVEAVEMEVVSITAEFTQGSHKVYVGMPLDTLKKYLVVTAVYEDSSSGVVPNNDYTLSGTLTVGASTITVEYKNTTDAFEVVVDEMILWIDGYNSSNNTSAGMQYTPFTYIDSVYTYDYSKSICALKTKVKTAGKLTISKILASACTEGTPIADVRGSLEKIEVLETTQTGEQFIYLSEPLSLSTGELLAIGDTTDTLIFAYGTYGTQKGFGSNSVAQGNKYHIDLSSSLGMNVYVV